MTVGLHTLRSTNKRAKARVGRGGKRGKTSGRGMKGQKARAGNSTRPELRDIIKKLPKKRGYGKNRARTVNSSKVDAIAVSLAKIEAIFSAGETVSPRTLVEKGIISRRGGKTPPAKILANGELTKKVTVEGVAASSAARAAIEKAGGSIA